MNLQHQIRGRGLHRAKTNSFDTQCSILGGLAYQIVHVSLDALLVDLVIILGGEGIDSVVLSPKDS